MIVITQYSTISGILLEYERNQAWKGSFSWELMIRHRTTFSSGYAIDIGYPALSQRQATTLLTYLSSRPGHTQIYRIGRSCCLHARISLSVVMDKTMRCLTLQRSLGSWNPLPAHTIALVRTQERPRGSFRLIDALEMMKQGVKRLLVPKSVIWKGVSKKFSILYNGKWLKNIETGNNISSLANLNRPSSSTTNITKTKYCCLSREDVVRFLIGCLGALAPIPLSSISSLGAINPHYSAIEAFLPAVEATKKLPHDPSAVAVVEPAPDGQHKIIGEISACKLWKCDYLAAAYALANLSAGQFVMGVEDNMSPRSVPDIGDTSAVKGDSNGNNGSGSMRLRRFSSRSIGFFGNAVSPNSGSARSMYRGRSAPLTCRVTSSLAAVMAQMLSHRATHVWVTEGEDDVLVGVVGYGEIMHAVTNRPPSTTVSSNQ